MKDKSNWFLQSMRPKLLFTIFVFMMLCSVSVKAQKQNITGVVKSSEDNMPIPGVSIVIKGATQGTITDFDGKYTVKAKLGDELRFSFIGMEDHDVKVDRSVIDITLNPSVIGLEEVVAIGYGVVKKKELTGAVARIKSEEITRTVTSDVGSALQGLVAGVNVTAASGQPGESAGILIRGVTSIEGSNDPLYVVDGIPQEGDPRLSPSEIESVDVLKDAASCAIYGSRGASGVILYTTKQGKAGSMRIGLDAVYGVQDIRSGTPLMNSSDQVYADLIEMRNTYDNQLDDNTLLKMLRSNYYFNNETDLSEYVYKDLEATQSYNLNISGGSKELTYNVTAGYYNQSGVVVNSGFERFNTRINTVYKHDKWRITANVGMIIEEKENAPSGIVGQAIKYHPTNKELDLSNMEPIYGEGDNDTENLNWVLQSFRNEDQISTHNSNANISLNYQIMKGLSASTRFSYKAVDSYRHQFKPYQEVYDGDGELKSDPMKDSKVSMTATKNRSMTFGSGLTYDKSFNKKHNITLYAGQEVEQYVYESFYASKVGVVNNNIDILDGAIYNPDASSLANDYTNKLVGFIGRAQYNYKSKYLLSGSVRYDGSTKFAKDNQWGFFPSASASWVMSDEEWMEPLKGTVNTFKIRASHGEVGNQNFSPYRFTAGIVNGADYIFNNEIAPGATLASYANAKVRWETSIQDNIGLDLAFLKNKITFTAEYYNTRKKDMLMPITVPGSAGSLPNESTDLKKDADVILNIGNMTNQGLEFAVSYKAKTGSVNWNLTGTFSTNSNEITSMAGIDGFKMMNDNGLISGKKATSQVTAMAKGYEAGAFFLFPTNGVIKTEEQLTAYQKIDSNAKMGDLIYIDSDGSGLIDDQDRVYCGSGLPEYEAGLNVSLDYKGIDFSMQWYSAIGHEIMDGAKATAYTWNRHADMTSQWTTTNQDSDIPSYRGTNHANVYGNTDQWVSDGTFVRLKNVTLGYTLPKRVISNVGISKCRFYVSAQNPLTFTNYEGFDPEVGGKLSSKGLDKGNYPVTSLYSVGVNLNF